MSQASEATSAATPAVAAAAPAPQSGGEAAAPPAWKSFSAEKLAQIASDRDAVRARGPLVMDPKGTYGLICRACMKPNSVDVPFCTGCSFPSQPEDVQRLPDNIFKQLVDGEDIGATVRYRDAASVVFDDKYPCSDNHLDAIPTEVYEDIRALTGEHLPMLERLYSLAREEFLRRDIPWLTLARASGDPLASSNDLDELITAGYNFPVSVKHLHLHAVLPPFKHEKVFQYPRWHSHAKVVRDLRQHGRVQLYSEVPDEAEGAAEYARAMRNSQWAKKWQESYASSKQAEEAADGKSKADSN